MIKNIRNRVSFVLLIGVVVALLPLLRAGHAEAQERKKLTSEQKKVLQAAAKEKLNGTIWKVGVREIDKEDGNKRTKKTYTDRLHFEDMKLRSEAMGEKGFGYSGYSIRIKGREGERVIWETMQTAEDKSVAFWRGEIRQEFTSVRGVMSWHIDREKGVKKDYTFSGKIEEQVVEEELVIEEMPVVEEEPAAEGAAADIMKDAPELNQQVEIPKAAEEAVVEAPKKVEAEAVKVEEPVVKEVKEAAKQVKKEEPKKKPWWRR